jgi:multimeric flavodoxin WrbA
MTRRILAVTTSPRRHGNSEDALDTVLKSFEDSAKFNVEKLVLNDLSIAPCKGCGACEKLGECIQKDDYQATAEKIRTADAVIFASPVYSLSLPAQAKALIDRCQVFWSQKFVLHTFTVPREDRLGLFIATAGQPQETIFEHAVPVARFLFEMAGIRKKNTGLLLLHPLDQRDAFRNSPDTVRKAQEAGELLRKSVEALP